MNQENIFVTTSKLKQVRNFLAPSLTEVKAHKLAEESCYPTRSPINPFGMASTVLNVPRHEISDFIDHVVKRYISTIKTHTIDEFKGIFKRPSLKKVTNDEFTEYMTETAFSRYLNPTLDPVDKENFSQFLVEGKTYFKSDLSPLHYMDKINDLNIEATVTLFEKNSDGFRAVAIFINEEVFSPVDGDKWELAKYFVLQGSSTILVGCVHPRIHFPVDSINALTKYLLPEDHPIRMLIEPHCYMQLPLNFAVLYISKSIAHNDQNEVYNPFVCTKKGFFNTISCGYSGIEGNSSYPHFKYSLEPEKIHSTYGEFLEGYWNIIYKFTSDILKHIDFDDPLISLWANEISHFVPGFPNAEAVKDKDILFRAITNFIYTVAVAHSSDHYNYAEMDILQVPLRLRAQAPSKSKPFSLKQRKLITYEDYFRHKLAWRMYFKPNNIITLLDTKYQHTAEYELQQIAEFKSKLIDYDKNLKVKKYIPITEMACSIQY
jgi:hypothetical protein